MLQLQHTGTRAGSSITAGPGLGNPGQSCILAERSRGDGRGGAPNSGRSAEKIPERTAAFNPRFRKPPRRLPRQILRRRRIAAVVAPAAPQAAGGIMVDTSTALGHKPNVLTASEPPNQRR
jgi:hypothetical protein